MAAGEREASRGRVVEAMLEYSVDDNDLVAFQEHHFATSPTMRKAQNRNRYGVAAFYLLLGAGFLAAGQTGGAVGLALVAALWPVWYPSYARRTLRKRARAMAGEGDNSNVYGPHQIGVEGSEVVVNSPSGTSRIRASSLARVDATDTHLFIYLSGVHALLIPRAKVRTGDVAAFERELRAAIQGAA